MAPPRKQNRFLILDGQAFMFFDNRREFTFVDPEDIEKLKLFCWYYNDPYVKTEINGQMLYLHNFVLGKVDLNNVVDHINRNTLDNRKKNLREVSKSLDKHNKTGYKEVFYHKRKRKYQASISLNGKRIYLGHFKTFEEAKQAGIEAEEKENLKC